MKDKAMERTKKGQSHPSTSKTTTRPARSYRSSNLIQDIYTSSSRKLSKISNAELFFLSIFGGAFITVGALTSLMLNMEVVTSGAQFILITLGLTAGFILALLTNSVLFSEANVYVPANFFNYSVGSSWLQLAKFWLISWFGNLIGAVIVAFLVYLANYYSVSFVNMLESISANKLAVVKTLRFQGPGELMISGVLAAWVLSMVSFAAHASRNLINQFIILFLGVLIITAANFQYYPINLGYFTLNVFLGRSPGILDVIILNLVPVSIGNVLGATILVAWPLLYLQKRGRR